MKKTILLTFATFTLLVCFLTLPVFAQEAETIVVQKSGRFHLGKAVLVRDKKLESGMYQVQHMDEKGGHIVAFRMVEMGYRDNMGEQKLGAEVARVKCTVEAVDKKIKDTKILIRKNAAGEREAFEVWIRGEKVKHIFRVS
jgi:hypothetical protein